MPQFATKNDTTSQFAEVYVQDSSQTDGRGLTGLVYNSAGLVGYYKREGGSVTAINLVDMTLNTWTSGGFKEISSSNMPGLYQLGLPDECLAGGAKYVTVMLRGGANMAPCIIQVEIEAIDRRDAVRGGMSALPAAAAEAEGGLVTLLESLATMLASLATMRLHLSELWRRLCGTVSANRVTNVLTVPADGADPEYTLTEVEDGTIMTVTRD